MTSKHDGMGNSFILAMILLLAGSQNEISKGKKSKIITIGPLVELVHGGENPL
jgi:hypothetical protein